MQEKPSRRSNKQRSEDTRALLITVARQLFCSHGYADTGTPEIVAKAKVTRGALYHHFDGKAALFQAVAMQMADEVAAAIQQESSEAGSALDGLRLGAKAYFSAMAEQDRARILLLEAAAVLDREQLRVLSDAAGSHELQAGLLSILPVDSAVPIGALTELLSAAFDRAALEIANGASVNDYEKAVNHVLEALDQV